MTAHEIEIKINIKKDRVNSVLDCYFWFENPITKRRSLIAEYKESGESTVNFIKRIKKYIKSNRFVVEIKKAIIKDVKNCEKENILEKEFEEVKKELDGLTFKINVDID